MTELEMPAWPADNPERRPIESLIPYAGNPMTHPPTQIELLKRSLREFGWTMPVLVDEDGGIIAGHGRVMAAMQLGIKIVPCMVAKGWSEARKRAYVIADNQYARLGEWDHDLLKVELGDLGELGYDLSLTGFGEIELVEFMTGLAGGDASASSGQQQQELTDDDRLRLNKAWRPVVKKWGDIWRSARQNGYASPTFIREALAVYFVRAQLYGYDIPRNATISYCLHRMSEVGDSFSMDDLFEKAVAGDDKLNGLQFSVGGLPHFDKIFSGPAIYGHRMPQEFPALLARNLIDEFCPKGGSVLDPCHGWGGRLLGFLLSKAGSYYGVDASEQTSAGVNEMAVDLRPYAQGERSILLKCAPFEDVKLPSTKFDFALTSPPYFNTEKYSGERSSWRRYPTYDEWVAGFYEPMIAKVAKVLRDGGVFALQVGSQAFPLEDDAKKIAPKHGLDHVTSRRTEIVNNQMPHDNGGEVVVVLCKRGRDLAARFGTLM